jgi:cell division protein FtsQ
MKRWGVIAGWTGFAVVLIAVLVLAGRAQEQAVAKKPNIAISVVDENNFLTEKELLDRLRRNNLMFDGQLMEHLKTDEIEAFIRKMHEVESVEVFRRLGGNWDIRLKIRQPLARVFNTKGESFYIDAKGATMDPSPNFTARVFVFSGNIPDRSDSLTVDDILKNDSLREARLLDDIYRIAKYVAADPFLRAQISQVVRMKSDDFVLIPQVGSHRIIFGSAFTDADVKEKMDKLKTFYKEGLPYEGWAKYETINLKFRNQIVCKKKEEPKPEVVEVPEH